jgi:hypothetical protein
MASLMIVCPETDEEVYTGIETDEASFRKLPDVPSPIQCPACGARHFWTKHQASLSTKRLKQVA